MGSYDGAKICELVGSYILDHLAKVHAKCDIGLYRDDGLAVIRNATGKMADRTRKDFTQDIGLKITAEANLKIVNFSQYYFELVNRTIPALQKANRLTERCQCEVKYPPPLPFSKIYQARSEIVYLVSPVTLLYLQMPLHYTSTQSYRAAITKRHSTLVTKEPESVKGREVSPDLTCPSQRV